MYGQFIETFGMQDIVNLFTDQFKHVGTNLVPSYGKESKLLFCFFSFWIWGNQKNASKNTIGKVNSQSKYLCLTIRLQETDAVSESPIEKIICFSFQGC